MKASVERETKWKKQETYLTFKHCKLGTGVDLAGTVSGRALVNGFVSVRAQRLDPQYGARTVVKFDHLKKTPQESKDAGTPFLVALILHYLYYAI